MRVLAVSSSGRLGGAELALCEILRRRPAEAEVYALVVGEGPLAARMHEIGVPAWVATAHQRRPSPRSLGAFTRSLLELLRRVRPQVVLAAGVKAAFLAAPGARLGGVPIVWQKVDLSLDSQLSLPLAALVDGVVSVSEAAAASLGPLRERRLLDVVGTPVALPEMDYELADERAPAIGTLGSLIPYKGHHHIVRAAALLVEEFPDLRVVLAGAPVAEHPRYPEELERLAAELGIARNVEIAGFVHDVTPLLSSLRVYVNATHRDERGFGLEGLSGGMLEAAWIGLPVVASRGGGNAEALLEGVSGTLVEPRDPAAIAGATARYLRDAALARTAGEAGRRFVRERFAAEAVAGRVYRALQAVAKDDGRRG
ncbi:MAG TPA: glycosyltransferase family 4 protein [Solirubrobacteraceae bacterium]|nr:glycosyltransferase family 4 protein [Solirubrobacteraceae bacterium]